MEAAPTGFAFFDAFTICKLHTIKRFKEALLIRKASLETVRGETGKESNRFLFCRHSARSATAKKKKNRPTAVLHLQALAL